MATSIRPFRRSWLLGGLVLLLACGGGGSTESSTAAPPVIGAFAVAPTTITSGQDVTLTWSVSSAESLSLSPGIGVVTGTSATVHVSATTTYTLTATNANGTDTAQSTVTLAPAGTVRIVYLHHSTGGNVWGGGVPGYFTAYNTTHGTHYQITERAYPDAPYPWANYPYDYWNLWVNPSGPADDGNPNIHSLEKLCSDYDVIVFKHCFPVSDLEADTGSASVSSSVKRAENYKLQVRWAEDPAECLSHQEVHRLDRRGPDVGTVQYRERPAGQGLLRLGQEHLGCGWRQCLRLGLLRAGNGRGELPEGRPLFQRRFPSQWHLLQHGGSLPRAAHRGCDRRSGRFRKPHGALTPSCGGMRGNCRGRLDQAMSPFAPSTTAPSSLTPRVRAPRKSALMQIAWLRSVPNSVAS